MDVKLKYILFIIFWVFLTTSISAQLKYSVDIEPAKNRRIPVKYFITQTKENAKINLEINKKHRIENKTSKKIRKHVYNNQTRTVKKRMRKSQKMAENYNRGKVPISVKLKKYFKWMI